MRLNFVEALEKTAADIKRPRSSRSALTNGSLRNTNSIKAMTANGRSAHSTSPARGRRRRRPGCTRRLRISDRHLPCATPSSSTPRTAPASTRPSTRLKHFLTDSVKCWADNGAGSLKEGVANAVGHKFTGVIRWRADRADPRSSTRKSPRPRPSDNEPYRSGMLTSRHFR